MGGLEEMVYQRLRVLTYNICKGNGSLAGRRYEVGALGDALATQELNLVLCQEVFHGRGQALSQTRELAQVLGMSSYYKPNKHRRVGHHGNATFSRLPVDFVHNFDISVNSIERRGVLYVRIALDSGPLHVFNAHLSLSHGQRLEQIRRIASILELLVPAEEPVLLAGDFNDWRRLLEPEILKLGFVNAFGEGRGRDVLTWHARRPVFSLDRVYLRNIAAPVVERLDGEPWSRLSDHLPLAVEISLPTEARLQA